MAGDRLTKMLEHTGANATPDIAVGLSGTVRRNARRGWLWVTSTHVADPSGIKGNIGLGDYRPLLAKPNHQAVREFRWRRRCAPNLLPASSLEMK
jgi:hypothetical protein